VAEWKRAGRILRDAGLLTLIDRQMFATYCAAVARQAQAQRHINQHGLMLADRETGMPVTNPAQKVIAEASATVHRLAREFGMSASARATVKAGKSAKDTEAEARRAKFAILGAKAPKAAGG
jgi:P27 family predicted phage terminase small subunit